MSSKIKTIVVIALLTSFASAALAQRMPHQPIRPEQTIKGCVTDEGQGRTKPCDSP
jgi:hypothetical protein